jgi:hypothetical protein
MLPTFAIVFLLAATGSQDAAQPFRIEPGDYRPLKFNVHKVPTEVDAHFEVLSKYPSVSLELVSESGFRQFKYGQDYEPLAATPQGRDGHFRRVIDRPGAYEVIVHNARGSPSATAILHVRIDMNPGASVTRTLSPGRRLAVIGLSIAFFLITVAWSGRKLFRAMRPS